MSIRWLRIKISWGYRPPKKDLTCNYRFRQQGMQKQARENKKYGCVDRERWQKHGNEHRTTTECKSTQASRATSFMLTCASPNMPCGDYFPTASDVTIPLLSLLLTLPCFFPLPSLQSEYICLCPLDFRLSLRLFDKLHRQNFRGSLLMTGLCHISRLLQLRGRPGTAAKLPSSFWCSIYEKQTSNVCRNSPNR